jgi:hypothetical protein
MQTSIEDRPSEPTARERPRGEDLDRLIGTLEASSRRHSLSRLAAFGIFLLALLGANVSIFLPLVLAPAALAVFIAILLRHGRILEEKEKLERRRLLLGEAEERRSSRRRDRHPPPLPPAPLPLEEGRRLFREEEPAFALDGGVIDDLNLLEGPRTLFGFLDVSSTALGARRLRYLMVHLLARPADIRARQEAVCELAASSSSREALLEALAALRRHSFAALPKALKEPAAFAGRGGVWALSNLLGTTAPALLVLMAFWPALMAFFFLNVLVNLAFIGIFVRQSNPARDRLLLFGPLLRGILEIEANLRGAAFRSRDLDEAARLLAGLRPAAEKLERRVRLLELHSYGVVFELFNVLALWELRILPLAERLFGRHRDLLEQAAGALGEIEALLSLSLPLVEQAGFVLPEPLERGEPLVEAEELGHPLVDPTSLVRNPLALGAGTNVWIITGSNMAGKSTFIKAAGINLVLAGMGGPVCARSFRWTPMALVSDINVRDSLDDGKSYFQVEVERVREAIRQARRSPKLFAIFDELFRGTNSVERLALSRAILRHLRSRGILLCIATHDGALTRLVGDDREPGMANYHLREEVHDGVMTFDYRLRPGPACSRNAIRVLEISGYPEEITREARREAGE